MQSKNRAKCCKNTAVISRRVRLELTTFDFNGLEYCFILNRSLPILFQGGFYGTGKSYAVLTLKKLLEADEEETKAYFQRYNLDNDLLNKYLGLKKNKEQKLITVHRYGAQSILNEQDLVLAVQESIKEALEANGVEYKGESSLQ